MITNQEINAVKLSATKKDFYQIWNELLDTASKLSERWDPASTNESDPGIVLLKVLTAVADKLNYSIDTNILEAFMPTAAQEESMRKLTEMLGYSMKYYRSATTDVTISYAKTAHFTVRNGPFCSAKWAVSQKRPAQPCLRPRPGRFTSTDSPTSKTPTTPSTTSP